MTPAQLAKQAAAILERAAFGNVDPGDIERARRWLIEAAGMVSARLAKLECGR